MIIFEFDPAKSLRNKQKHGIDFVAAHSLSLSGALLTHKKAHTVLPLSGVTHMTPQEIISENLMLLTVEYFKSHLGY